MVELAELFQHSVAETKQARGGPLRHFRDDERLAVDCKGRGIAKVARTVGHRAENAARDLDDLSSAAAETFGKEDFAARVKGVGKEAIILRKVDDSPGVDLREALHARRRA